MKIFLSGLKFFLMAAVGISLGYSIFLDCRPGQMPKLNAMRDDLSFRDLLTLETEGAVLNSVEIRKYLRYFELLSEEASAAAEVYAGMGFCYYHLGEKRKAMFAYQKAVSLNPYFLGFQYNLGVVYFEQGKYAQALGSFQKALNTRMELNLLTLRSSKVLGHMIDQSGPLNPPLSERFKRTYGGSAYWASVCSGKLGNPSLAAVLRRQSIRMGIDASGPAAAPRLYLF